MTFGQAISTCFRKFVTFRGRAPRSEYWYFLLFGVLLSIPASIIDLALSNQSGGTPGARPLTGLLSLVLFLPRLSVSVRRLHDVNYSGWFLGGFFIYLVAAVGIIIAYAANVGSNKPDFASPIGIFAIVAALGMFAWIIWLFVLTVLKGTSGPNKYGDDPLGANADVFN